jgi:hypothetical protein
VTDHHQIKVNEQLPRDELLQTLIFECCNALDPKFTNLTEAQFTTAGAYAKFIEEGEHQSFQLAYHIYSYGMENAGWPMPTNPARFTE